MSRCIVNVAVGERYIKYQNRLTESLLKFSPKTEAELWMGVWPPSSPPHQEMHYAFKYYAVKEAVKNSEIDTAIWLDSACYLVADPTEFFNRVEEKGIYVIYGDWPLGQGGERLGEWISDEALDYFKVSREEAMDIHICGGAVVGLNLKIQVAQDFLGIWGELAKSGLFMSAHSKYCPDRMRSLALSDGPGRRIVSEDPRVKGHRSDEACFALVLRKLGVAPVPLSEWNKTFKSGYDLC